MTVRRPVVLVIDDEEMVRLAIQLVLESEGYEVLQAGDGLEGIRTLERERVDLVVTDMRMPRAGGAEVLAAVRGRTPPVKVIVITGYTAQDPETAMAMGADAFVYKVFSREDLLQRVRLLVGEAPPVEG
jgi:CheY-like chemotaxis protein